MRSTQSQGDLVERRRHRRLAVALPVECRRAKGEGRSVFRTTTSNVSTGGIYLETESLGLRPEDRLHLKLTIPPSEGICAHEGRAECEAEVIRCKPLEDLGLRGRLGVALRFVAPLKLQF